MLNIWTTYFYMMKVPLGYTSGHVVRGEVLILAGEKNNKLKNSNLFDCMGSEKLMPAILVFV